MYRTLALTICAFAAVCWYVPFPYMDEIFHVPQTQRYCRGDFSTWDPKITTPPGFQLLAALYGRVVDTFATLAGFSNGVCPVAMLRSVNVVLWVCNVWLLRQLKNRRSPDSWAACLSCLPVYWFYSALLYTDTMSMTSLLSVHLCLRQDWRNFSALLGVLSILIRQTNAVWYAFFLFESVEQFLRLEHQSNATVFSDLLRKIWRMKSSLLKKYWSDVMILLMFGAFVWSNGGVVVGDKSAHQPVLHGAQIPYFFLTLWVLVFPYILQLSELRKTLSFSFSNGSCAVLSGSCFFLFAFLLKFGRVAHPYLLSDNRHVTFYLWRWFLSKDGWIYSLAPASWISALTIVRLLQRSRLWILAFMICSATVTVPNGLLEFRYFLPATFVAGLHLVPQTLAWYRLQWLVYLAVQGYMLYLFLLRPFSWPDGSEARFVW